MKATIISIAPVQIKQSTPSIVPPDVLVEACTDENIPVFSIIPDVKTIEYIPLKEKGKGGRLNPIDGFDYAKSIVNDFLNSIVYSNIGDGTTPGVIAVEGIASKIEPDKLKELQARQLKWKNVIIDKTDDVWNKFGQRKFIMGLAVVISKQMNLDREWAKKASDSTFKVCPACFSNIHPMASICAQCKTIVNAEKYELFQKAMS